MSECFNGDERFALDLCMAMCFVVAMVAVRSASLRALLFSYNVHFSITCMRARDVHDERSA